MIWILLWSKTKIGHNQFNQLNIKQKKSIPEESETNYRFQGEFVGLQHWFDLDLDCIEDKFMKIEHDFSKGYTLNILQSKPISIGFHFMFQLEM